MKSFRKVFLLLALVVLAACCRAAWCGPQIPERLTRLRAMSFNIRYNTRADGENAWPHRKDMVAGVIRFHHADLAGLQEALIGQVRDLEERLPEYDWIGVGRRNGKQAGEFTPIFYRRDRFELLTHDTFWLSEHPEEPGSMGWDAACPRTVTWAKFRDRLTGRSFYHFNTHFDHRGERARRESARLLLSAIRGIAGETPVVVTGDFNCQEDSAPYRILTENEKIRPLKDARFESVHGHHGPTGTFGGFTRAGTPGEKIDYVFVDNGVKVLQHGVLADNRDGRYPSDHLPVLAELKLQVRR